MNARKEFEIFGKFDLALKAQGLTRTMIHLNQRIRNELIRSIILQQNEKYIELTNEILGSIQEIYVDANVIVSRYKNIEDDEIDEMIAGEIAIQEQTTIQLQVSCYALSQLISKQLELKKEILREYLIAIELINRLRLRQLEITKAPLNKTQENIIEQALKFIFDSIAELKPIDAIQALQAITSENLSENEIEKFAKQNCWHCINEARELLLHPHLQNRSMDDPHLQKPADSSLVIYKNNEGELAYENKGLLNLTAHNDDKTAVTKEAVVACIKQLIGREINKHQEKLNDIQSWYKKMSSLLFHQTIKQIEGAPLEVKAKKSM